MDFGWNSEELAFRDRVREFIHTNWNGADPEEGDGDEAGAWERTRAYQKEMAKHGWLTMAWPKEYGGQAASFMEQMIFAEESALVGAPGGAECGTNTSNGEALHREAHESSPDRPRFEPGSVECVMSDERLNETKMRT